VPVTKDPIADLFALALTCRRVARENPHLYDLMFGLSTRATYRPLSDSDVRLSGRSPAFRGAYVHITQACERLLRSGRVRQQEPEALAAQLWSFVHGYITLELAEHFVEFDDPVAQVLVPMGVSLAVGLGDKRERAEVSHATAARLYDSVTLRTTAPSNEDPRPTQRGPRTDRRRARPVSTTIRSAPAGLTAHQAAQHRRGCRRPGRRRRLRIVDGCW
jgi:hypothetical protein